MDQDQELRFVRHLFDQVKNGLTGETDDEVVGTGPRDQYHAGVLLPLQRQLPTDDNAMGVSALGDLGDFAGVDETEPAMMHTQKIDTDSSMSIDFQVLLPEGQDEFVLRIQPRFNVYYAVFPTYKEVMTHHDADPDFAPDEAQSVNDTSESADTDPEDQQTEPDVDLVKPEQTPDIVHQLASEVALSFSPDPPLADLSSDEREALTDPGPTGNVGADGSVVDIAAGSTEKDNNTIILPRKFRRRTVQLPVLEIPVNVRRIASTLEVRDPFTSTLTELRTYILHDPDLWRHLGKPSEGLRELVGHGLLSSESTYMSAWRSQATGDAALPAWRAYLSISGLPTLAVTSLDPDAAKAPQDRARGRIFRLNVALINATPGLSAADSRRAQLEETALFNSGFSIEAEGVELVPFVFQGTPKDYRYDRDFPALGSNCVAVLDPVNPRMLHTETVPLYMQKWYRTRDNLPVNFADLDTSSGNDPLQRLESIASAMDAYLAEWDDYLLQYAAKVLNPDQVNMCQQDRQAFHTEAVRYKLGITVLKRDHDLQRAFRLMNSVFRRNGEQRNPAIHSWRLFQIAFLVTQLPALAARELDLTAPDDYSQNLKAALEKVDVLWFPTGGGKTEAYLGLITTALFYDRLRGKDRGVTAWMRFPLRMLSLQQLDRLGQVVAQAEMLRAAAPDLANAGSPFSIGYYVGSGNTPNSIREVDPGADNLSNRDWSKQQIIRNCPFCRSKVEIKFDRGQWRLVHFCSNPQCYSNANEGVGEFKGSLPIFVVDNEVYRYRPSVLVGTVDKLAVLGFQKNFAHLLTSVNQRCPAHGYLSFGECIEKVNGGPCKHKSKEYIQLRPEKDPVPALLIQDELHLLKEELGTFNAHYEGFLHHLAVKQGFKSSKILAATATIEAYEEQIAHLYLKGANRFPQPGWLMGESFYATSTPAVERRLYAGVLTHQRSPETTALRALYLYHREMLRMKANPKDAMAKLEVENLSEEEFLHFLHLYDLSLTYVNRKATGGNIEYGLYQTVAPQLGHDIRQPDFRLGVGMLTGDNTMTEVGQVIERIERERTDVEEGRLEALIATSLISHGVDLERINFLCMVGMPSKYAEYIQASSRAARNHVGIVLVCFKRGDLRERSQYHYFLPNHKYIDRLVEPVPINRFSSFAPKRTVPGLLAGMLLSYYSRLLFRTGHIKKPLDDIRELQRMIASKNITLQQMQEDLEEIIGTNYHKLTPQQVAHLTEAIKNALEQDWDAIQRSYDNSIRDVLHPMSSFRDVDETISFVADGAAASFVERISAG